MRMSDWSSDVCSSDRNSFSFCKRSGSRSGGLFTRFKAGFQLGQQIVGFGFRNLQFADGWPFSGGFGFDDLHQVVRIVVFEFPDIEFGGRSEEHSSELQSLMRISYAVFCLKKKK